VTVVLRNSFRALIAPGKQGYRAFTPAAAAGGVAGGVTEIWLYGVIDTMMWWGDEITAAYVVEALQSANGGDVLIHLNSPGGDVFEALAIYATIANHPGAVTVRVEGIAASCASVIMLAANTVEMMPLAAVMIHDPWSICIGNAGDMRTEADKLDQAAQNMAGAYAARAGGTVETWRTAMQAETWYYGQEAVDAGLADTVLDLPSAAPDETTQAAVSALDRWNLTAFDKAPTLAELAARTRGQVPPAVPPGSQSTPDPLPDSPLDTGRAPDAAGPTPVVDGLSTVLASDPGRTEPDAVDSPSTLADPLAPAGVISLDLDALRSALKGVIA
jgi:ATP-dependent protease ClpP protease subunit